MVGSTTRMVFEMIQTRLEDFAAFKREVIAFLRTA